MRHFDCASWWVFFFFKQKTAYEMRISDWSSDVCSSDLDSLSVFDSFSACACRSSALARAPAVFLLAVFLNLAMCPPTGPCDCKAASPHCLAHSHEPRRPVQRLRARLRVVVSLAMPRWGASRARPSLAGVACPGGGGRGGAG